MECAVQGAVWGREGGEADRRSAGSGDGVQMGVEWTAGWREGSPGAAAGVQGKRMRHGQVDPAEDGAEAGAAGIEGGGRAVDH